MSESKFHEQLSCGCAGNISIDDDIQESYIERIETQDNYTEGNNGLMSSRIIAKSFLSSVSNTSEDAPKKRTPKDLTGMDDTVVRNLSSGHRVEISLNEQGAKLNINEGNIVLDKINFTYKSNPENKVLHDMSLKFVGGKMTALVGHSGSGKSTLLNMIPRIYLPTSGNIYFDNQDISKVNLASLRNQISIVDQNTTLFDDTVLNNIKYARPDADKEDIIEAAKLSMSDEFINNLENGYETMIGENGVKLSGGEKQRLSIARAFLKNSKIILLDEATSSLDSETEEKIQKALNKLTTNKTTIVIAHRLSTILNSDNIYVVDGGKIIDSGKHDDLLNNSKIYKNFYQRQLKQN